jgi:ribosomal protein S18 acetylase RimI-like enzyme
MQIRPATPDDHKRLCEIARSHRAGNGFSNIQMFSGPTHYANGWLRVMVDAEGKIVAFTCIRQKKTTKQTKLYYIIVDTAYRSGGIVDNKPVVGIGQALLDDLITNSPYRELICDCLKDNEPALKFYKKNGFEIVGESLKGKGHILLKKW